MAQNDHELIQKARRGDKMAFEQLVFRYDRQVLSIAAKYTNNHDDAKDIYQEVFLRVYKSLKNFESRSEFSTWLFRITTNVCITYHTNKQKRTHYSLDNEWENNEGETMSFSDVIEGGDSTDQQAINSEIAEHIHEAVNTLSPQQKMVFNLRHYHGYKLKEISTMMNCTEGTVKKYLFTAVRRLRDQLKDIKE
jgi:RNA polymerase sigma-70 factor (ECF subfamily)